MHKTQISRFIKLIIEAEEVEKVIVARDNVEKDLIEDLKKLARLIKKHDKNIKVSFARRQYWYDREALYFLVNKKVAIIIFGYNIVDTKRNYRVRYKFITEKFKKDTNNKLFDITLDDFVQRIDDASSLENYEKYLYYKDYKIQTTSEQVIEVFEQFIKKFNIDTDCIKRDLRIGKTIFSAIVDYKSGKHKEGDNEYVINIKMLPSNNSDNVIKINFHKGNMTTYQHSFYGEAEINVNKLSTIIKVSRNLDEFMVLVNKDNKYKHLNH